MNPVLQQLQQIGIVPVVTIHRAEDAVPLAKALCAGGIPCAEVTFRTEAAQEAIRAISEHLPEMLVGAGTVLTTEQVDRAVGAGASFIVSPGLNPEVVRYCNELGVPVTPGCATPSDVERAMELGLEAVKFFPAEAAGGLPMIKAMAAPYHKMLFMPTGGISPKNLNSYLAFPKILACGGSWMVKEELIEAKNFDEIARLTEEAVKTMLNFKLAHIGINTGDRAQQEAVAKQYAALFGFPVRETPVSYFASESLEMMSGAGRGTKGHLGFSCSNVSRAKRYLESKGVEFDPASEQYRVDGQLRFVYLQEELGGFAVHLMEE